MTNTDIQRFLTARGKTGTPLIDYILLGDDGSAQSFSLWNETTLGPAPTAADLTAMRTAAFSATSRQKDILATVALVVRAKGLAAWNGMTTPQKVAATLAEADAWATIRDFIEANVP